MTTNADVMNELANAAQSATALTQEVGDKVENINAAINQLNSNVDSAIANVNAAIPNAVKSQMLQVIYLDENNGDDANDGTSNKPKATFKGCVHSVPVGSLTTIRVKEGSNLTVNEPITIVGKLISVRTENAETFKLIINDVMNVYSSSLTFYYSIKEIIQSCATAFFHNNAKIRLVASKITASNDAVRFFNTSYNPPLNEGGGFTSELLLNNAEIISSSVSEYTIFDCNYYTSLVFCSYKDLIIGDNVKITSDYYTSERIGTENIYILGA